MKSPEVSTELAEFIRHRLRYPARLSIDPDTSVEDDLGVTGDDSPVFMEAFFDRFAIDSGDFDCSRYFEGEGVINPFAPISRFIFRRAGPELEREREPLTVAMLQRAIDLGVWNSERVKAPKD